MDSFDESPELTTDAWIDTLLNTQGLVDCHISLDTEYFVKRAMRLLMTSTYDYAERRTIEESLCDIVAFDEQDELLARLGLSQQAPNQRLRMQTGELSKWIRYISDVEQ